MINFYPTSSGVYIMEQKETSRTYIGSTFDFRQRWSMHMTHLNTNNHDNKNLQNDWNKYGQHMFHISALEIIKDTSLLLAREHYWINEIGKEKETYNLSCTGNKRDDFLIPPNKKKRDAALNMQMINGGLKSAYYLEISELLNRHGYGAVICVTGAPMCNIFMEIAREIGFKVKMVQKGKTFYLTILPKT